MRRKESEVSVDEIAAALSTAAVWGIDSADDEIDRSSHIAIDLRLRVRKRAEVRTLIPALLESVDERSWFEAMTDARYHNSAVVHELLEMAAAVREQHTIRCQELVQLAIYVAKLLPNETERSLTLGYAYKELANAFVTRGRYREALEALDDADALFRTLACGRYWLAVTGVTRSLVQQQMKIRSEESLQLLLDSAVVLEEHGDMALLLKVRLAEAIIYHSRREYARANELFLSLVETAERLGDLRTLPRIYNNAGHCFRELGDLAMAATYFAKAIALFDELKMTTETPRVRWGLARMERDRSRFVEAVTLLSKARYEFEANGNYSDAALVATEEVELLVVLGELDHAARISATLPQQFLSAGMSAHAIMAANFVNEIVASRRAQANQIRQVREYVLQLRVDPGLPFRRPELEP